MTPSKYITLSLDDLDGIITGAIDHIANELSFGNYTEIINSVKEALIENDCKLEERQFDYSKQPIGIDVLDKQPPRPKFADIDWNEVMTTLIKDEDESLLDWKEKSRQQIERLLKQQEASNFAKHFYKHPYLQPNEYPITKQPDVREQFLNKDNNDTK